MDVSFHETVDGDHGRIETRKVTVIHDVEWLQQRHNWPGLKSIIMVESLRETGEETSSETRFYISSLGKPAEQMGTYIRGHWQIESVPQAHRLAVFIILLCLWKAHWEMAAGPPESAVGGRLQTTSSGWF
jgi:predicted transposase YbfD/YdcC